MWQRYGKAIAAVVLGALTALQVATDPLGLGAGGVTSVEGVQITIAVLTGVGTWLIPLAPQYGWTKTAVNGLLAVAQVATTLVDGGVSGQEWTLLVMTALNFVITAGAPAESDNGVSARRAAQQHTSP